MLLAACAAPATHALPALTVPSPTATPSPSASPSPAALPTRQVRRVGSRAAEVQPAPVRVGPLAQSVQGSRTLATATVLSAAGPGQGPVTVVVFDPSATRLVLHAGATDPVAGWHGADGPVMGAAERAKVVAVFNSGFKRKDSHGGWMADGRTVVPLVTGAASVVTYADGGTDVGRWGSEVPAPGRRVVAVRQNLQLLVDAGAPQRTHPRDQLQLNLWWGHAYNNAPLVSRSALGVTADGRLVYAAGTRITVGALQSALLSQGVVRAMELDINAPLVRGFLVSGAAAVRTPTGLRTGMLPLVVGQTQGPQYSTTSAKAPHCTYVTACPRDFFTVVLR
jgi:hypothetical protein